MEGIVKNKMKKKWRHRNHGDSRRRELKILVLSVFSVPLCLVFLQCQMEIKGEENETIKL